VYVGGVSMSKVKARVQVGATLPPDLWERLRRSASRNGRTLSSELELAVSGHLDDDVQLTSEDIKAIKAMIKEQRNGNR
jgi:hypothetical protein